MEKLAERHKALIQSAEKLLQQSQEHAKQIERIMVAIDKPVTKCD